MCSVRLYIFLRVQHKDTNLMCPCTLVRIVLFNVSNCIRISNSHWSVQNSVTLCVRGLVLSGYDPYNLRYIVSTSACHHKFLDLVKVDCSFLWQVLSAAFQNFNISVAPNCFAAVHSVQSVCFCTHHICHISLSYI